MNKYEYQFECFRYRRMRGSSDIITLRSERRMLQFAIALFMQMQARLQRRRGRALRWHRRVRLARRLRWKQRLPQHTGQLQLHVSARLHRRSARICESRPIHPNSSRLINFDTVLNERYQTPHRLSPIIIHSSLELNVTRSSHSTSATTIMMFSNRKNKTNSIFLFLPSSVLTSTNAIMLVAAAEVRSASTCRARTGASVRRASTATPKRNASIRTSVYATRAEDRRTAPTWLAASAVPVLRACKATRWVPVMVRKCQFVCHTCPILLFLFLLFLPPHQTPIKPNNIGLLIMHIIHHRDKWDWSSLCAKNNCNIMQLYLQVKSST